MNPFLDNDKVQVSQKGENVSIQTIDKIFNISFEGKLEAMKFVTKITDTITGTYLTKRGADKVKDAINTVDDVLGFDTRNAVRGVLEKGVVGTIFKGIGKNNKK